MYCDPLSGKRKPDLVNHQTVTASYPLRVVGYYPPCVIPLMVSRIAAGFPSPADDYVEEQIDLNTLLLKIRSFVIQYPKSPICEAFHAGRGK